MIPALGISLWGGEGNAVRGFLVGIAAICVCGGVMMWYGKGSKKKFYAKEGLACVGLCWIVMSLLGCLPFFVSGEIPNYVDALFEMVSGFTTTGASILSDVEALSKGLLYWRSFSHWLGGMGVLVFVLAISSVGSGDRKTNTPIPPSQFFCWRFPLWEAATADLPSICLGRRAPDLLWESWCPKCVRQQRFCIGCISY